MITKVMREVRGERSSSTKTWKPLWHLLEVSLKERNKEWM